MTDAAYRVTASAPVTRRWDDTDTFAVITWTPPPGDDQQAAGAGKRPPPSAWWANAGTMAGAGVALVTFAACTAGIVAWFREDTHHIPARLLAIALVLAVVAIVGGVALVKAWGLRVDGRRRDQAEARLRAAVREQHAEQMVQIGRMAALVEQNAVRLGMVAAATASACSQTQALAQTLERLNGAFREMLDEFPRIARMLAERVSAMEATVADLHKRLDSAEEAMVTVACTLAPTQRSNGQIPTGLDPEVVELARQISDRLRGGGEPDS